MWSVPQLELALSLNFVFETLWTRAKSGLLISLLEKLTLFCLTGPITLVLMMWKRMGLFLRKSHLLRYWACLFLRNWIGIKFLSPQAALYLYKSTIQLCIGYYCHIWVGAPISWSRVRNLLILWEPLIFITSLPAVCYVIWKLEFVSNILQMIVDSGIL